MQCCLHLQHMHMRRWVLQLLRKGSLQLLPSQSLCSQPRDHRYLITAGICNIDVHAVGCYGYIVRLASNGYRRCDCILGVNWLRQQYKSTEQYDGYKKDTTNAQSFCCPSPHSFTPPSKPSLMSMLCPVPAVRRNFSIIYLTNQFGIKTKLKRKIIRTNAATTKKLAIKNDLILT